MGKKGLVLLAIVILAFSCKPAETPPADTIATTSAATDATAAPDSAALPPNYNLDHFKFWRIKTDPYTETLKLFGQADKDWWEAEIGTPLFLGNPVRKKHDGKDVSSAQYPIHYLAYPVKTKPQPPRKVVILNQIIADQKQEWYITDPKWLLVPTGKSLTGAPQPQKGDHFACYTVHAPMPIPVDIQLQDQFDVTLNQRWEKISELTPAYFCIPVQKQRSGKQPDPLINPETHLAIYNFKPDVLPNAIPASAIDQFREYKLRAVAAEWLGVPTQKLEKPVEAELPK